MRFALCAAAIALLLALCGIGNSQQLRSDTLVDRLVTDLCEGSYTVREKAAKRLEEIGLPALKALQEIEANGADLESRMRARQLVEKICAVNRQSIRVGGMEFRLTVDKEWELPAAGERSAIEMGLQVTNTRSYPLYLSLGDKTIWITLKKATGESLEGGFGDSDHSFGLVKSGSLKKNDSHFFRLSGWLKENRGSMTFFCSDGNMFGSYRTIEKGTYVLVVSYRSRILFPESNELIWQGSAEVVSETITVK